jgi:hypothetical protein
LNANTKGAIVCRADRHDVSNDHIELGHSFVEADLNVQWNIRALATVPVGGTPFDVKDAVRRGTADRGEDPKIGPGVIRARAGTKVGSVREDCVSSVNLRDAACIEVIVHRAES